ncbi:MAG: hypothetical protein O7F76_01725 [Planctomycetota bacterium]|nr:hypothetical protein [Planctomycetota bacterium]
MSIRNELRRGRSGTNRGWTGAPRDHKHFFYGICLIASGFIALFHWPPVPVVFDAIKRLCGRLGSPEWFASVIMLTLTVLPLVLGVGFLLSWFIRNTLRGKSAKPA